MSFHGYVCGLQWCWITADTFVPCRRFTNLKNRLQESELQNIVISYAYKWTFPCCELWHGFHDQFIYSCLVVLHFSMWWFTLCVLCDLVIYSPVDFKLLNAWIKKLLVFLCLFYRPFSFRLIRISFCISTWYKHQYLERQQWQTQNSVCMVSFKGKRTFRYKFDL